MRPAPDFGARHRLLRTRVLEALEQRVKQFIRREELWPLRIPRDPLLLDPIIDRALQGEHGSIDAATLRSRSLLRCEWPDGSAWEAWVIALPSGLKLYCDSIDHEHRALASGGRNEGDDSDRAFLQLLAESAGGHFGIEMSGGAPSRIRCAISERAFLVEVFVELFEVAGTEDSVRAQLGDSGPAVEVPGPDQGHDFRSDVERWLDRALTSSPAS